MPSSCELHSLDISGYVERSTTENFPFVRKVLTAYIETMLSESRSQDVLDLIVSNFDPEQSWFLFRELGKKAAMYSDVRFIPIFAYSVQHKDAYLLNMIAAEFNLGIVEARYGTELRFNVAEYTDPVTPIATDQGYITDMVSSTYPVFVLFLDFSYDSSFGKSLQSDVWNRAMEASNLFSLLKPARTPLLMIQRPNFVLSRYTEIGLTVTQKPLFTIFDGLGDTDIEALYTQLACTSSHSVTTVLSYHSVRKRIWTVFSEGEITECIINPGVSGYEAFRFVPNWDPAIFEPVPPANSSINYNKYCFRLCLNLSPDESQDTFDEV